MNPRRLPLWCVLAAMTACTPNVYRADVGAMFVRGGGEVALQNAGGTLVLANEQNDLDGDLDLGGQEASPYLRLEWERDLHRMRAHGFGIESSGSGTLSGDFGGILAGTTVNTSMDFLGTAVSYSYEVLGDRDYRLGLGGQLGYYLLDVDVQSGTASESVSTDALVPMPYFEGEYYLGPVTLAANLSFMAADLNDANGRYVDFEALARWRPTRKVEVIGGYRLLILDAYGQASTRDFDADVQFDGFFLGGGVRF